MEMDGLVMVLTMNCFSRSQASKMVIIRYDKSLHHLCVVVRTTEEDVNLMKKLGIFVNLNLVTCCLKLAAN